MNERLKNLKFCRDLALMPGKRHVQPAVQLCDNSLSSKQSTFHLWIWMRSQNSVVNSTLYLIMIIKVDWQLDGI